MRTLTIAAATLILLLGCSAAVYAAARGGSFSVSAVADGYTFDGEQHLETRPVVGARLGYAISDPVAIEGLFDYVSTTGTRDEGDADVFRYGADVLYHFFTEKDLVPYVAAGFGGIRISRDDSSDNSSMADYGVGLKYFLTDNFAVRGDLRHILLLDGEVLFNYEYTMGILYQFGGRKSAFVKDVAVAPAPAVVEPQEAPVPQPPEPPPAAEEPVPQVPATEPSPGMFKYCVTLNVEFDIDKWLVRPEYHDELGRVGNFMAQNPTTTAVIEGHTDDVGSAEYNLELSQKRAWSVVDYLVEHFGIDRNRLSARGFGKEKPIADNGSDAGKQQNRRIEAIIDCAFSPVEVSPPRRLCMQLKIEFEKGKADVPQSSHSEIAALADYMKRYPSTTALIEGHTDNQGPEEDNLKLSQLRAQNIVDHLVNNGGIEPARLTAKGYGSSRPVAYNRTPEGRQKNRRINAIIDCVILNP